MPQTVAAMSHEVLCPTLAVGFEQNGNFMAAATIELAIRC